MRSAWYWQTSTPSNRSRRKVFRTAVYVYFIPTNHTFYRQTILCTDKPASSNRSRRKVFGTAVYVYFILTNHTLYRQTSFFKLFTQKGVQNSIIHTLYWQTSIPWNCSCRNCVFATACILLGKKSMLFRTVGTEKKCLQYFWPNNLPCKLFA